MFITDLFEATNPMHTLVIYPGRFQPWHKGHRMVYDYLVKNFGRDSVFIATSNKVDPPRSPFSFTEKVQFMHLTGVSSDRIVETRDPYRALEIVQNYDPRTTRLIFAVSEKDMAEDPRFKFGTKKDGTPTYLQALPKDMSDMQSFQTHGYIMTVPTFNFTVLGQPMESATEVRAQFAQADEATQQNIINDLFGAYDKHIHDIMKQKIARPVTESVAVGTKLNLVKNYGNFKTLTGVVKDVTPSGKLKIQITQAETEPGKKGAVKVGDILTMASNYIKSTVAENFADGKNPGRKGLAKRMGVDTKAGVGELRKTAKNSTGEKARMAHWLANMKSGKIKENYNDEEESNLRSGSYVRDKEDSSGEVFIMRGDPYERRVQITDRNGSGWNISPSRLIAVDDNDPAIAQYFGQRGVAEGHDDEDLADQVYAEFERMYPNLARRADDRVIHNAIMDVLNYGGDNDTGALAADVARAVKQQMSQGVAEGSLNEFATGGEGGNGPFDYGSAIVRIGQDFVDFYNGEGSGADAAAIIKVGKTFISAGMAAGIKAFYAIDTQLRDHVAEQLADEGFNVKQDIYLPYKQQMAKASVDAKAKTDKWMASPEYSARKADQLTISAIPNKPINSWSKPGDPAASVSMDNASKRDVKAEFEKFKQDVARRDSLKGVPLKFVVTIGGKPVKIKEQGVAEGSLNEFAPGGNSASSYYSVTANFVNDFAQQKQEELQDLIDAGWTKQDLAQAGTLQSQAADIVHFEQVRDGFLKGLKPGFDAYLQGDTQLKDQLGEYWQENNLPLNQDWEKIYGEPWGRDAYDEGVAEAKAIKQRLDPKCWKGKHKEGTKIKGGVRVNNCVPNESVAEGDMKPTQAAGAEKPGAVAMLEKVLLKAKQRGIKLNYDNIDKMMQLICDKHNLTGDKLHDDFVKKHNMIPDNWIKKQGVAEGDENPYRAPSPIEAARIRQQTLKKLNPVRSQFVWKKPDQIGGSFTEQELVAKGFKKSQYNSWGGTQHMWDQLISVKEDAAGVGVIAKNKKMAQDPRYSMSMTADVKPSTPAKNMKALRLI